jgi:hypothetical protein
MSHAFATPQITLPAADQEANTYTGGPVGETTYKLSQFHLHWGIPGTNMVRWRVEWIRWVCKGLPGVRV